MNTTTRNPINLYNIETHQKHTLHDIPPADILPPDTRDSGNGWHYLTPDQWETVTAWAEDINSAMHDAQEEHDLHGQD